MIEVTYTTRNGRFQFKVTGSDHRDLFRQIQSLQEVFESTASAKINGSIEVSDDIRFVVRKAKYTDEKGKEKEADYFEQRVMSGPLVGYRKCFGVLDDGSGNLFPKRAPDKNVIYGYDGWHKYDGGE